MSTQTYEIHPLFDIWSEYNPYLLYIMRHIQIRLANLHEDTRCIALVMVHSVIQLGQGLSLCFLKSSQSLWFDTNKSMWY